MDLYLKASTEIPEHNTTQLHFDAKRKGKQLCANAVTMQMSKTVEQFLRYGM